MPAALEVSDLSKQYDGVCAVERLSFGVNEGEIAALIGPNGAGKTTTINAIAGAVRPTAGRVHFFGEDVTGIVPDRLARAGLVRTFQLVQLFPKMTVRGNVVAATHLHTRGGLLGALLKSRRIADQEEKIEREADELLDLVGLKSRANDIAGNLPYGQQKVLEIARALAAKPRMLLLDEPAAGLPPTETRELGGFIRRLREPGLTILFIEHDMNLVMTIAEKIVVLNFGNKIAEGTPAEVSANPVVRKAYLG